VTDANGTHARARICHIDRNGLVTSWDPGSDQAVGDIVIVDADYVAVSKAYSATLTDNTLGGFDCRGFGLVHRTTGVAMSWDPAVLLNVTSIAISAGRLFRGCILGATTTRLRSYTIATQTLDAWSPSAGGNIWDIFVDGGNIITGHTGNIAIGGVTRNKFARTSTTVSAGGVAAFNASLTAVDSTEGYGISRVDSSKVLLCGYNLDAAGAQAIKGAAIVSAATGVSDAWELVARSRNDVERHAVGHGRVLAHAGGDSLRVYDLATGVEVDAITVTGMTTYAGISYGRKYWFPRANRAVIFGSMTALGSRVVNGTSRMFVIDVP
jgi:hypothetical protein